MLKELRKGLLAGLGAVVLTKDKVEEKTRKLVADAKLSERDARKLADELVETGQRQWAELEKAVTDAIHKGVENLGFSRQKELKEIEAKLDDLEKRLSALEKSGSAKGE